MLINYNETKSNTINQTSKHNYNYDKCQIKYENQI